MLNNYIDIRLESAKSCDVALLKISVIDD